MPKARGTASRLTEEANGYRQRVIANAEGEAARFKQILVEYNKAPAVTRERIYLDTMQQILSTTSKMMVDPRGRQPTCCTCRWTRSCRCRGRRRARSASARPAAQTEPPAPPDPAPRSRDALRGAGTGGAAMNNRHGVVIGSWSMLVLLASLSLFTVDQRQSAIVFQLGEVKDVITEPGLHFKWPLIQNVRYFDTRILTLDTPDTERFITSEKKNVLVDSFVKWRIGRRSSTTSACRATRSARRRAWRRRSMPRCARSSASAPCTTWSPASATRSCGWCATRSTRTPRKIGVEIVDVRLKRVDLPQEVSESVYRRMEAERKSVANELRSQGFSEGEKIRAEADREREVIIAEAYNDAQRVKGEGDAKASAIYAQAFSENPEFYAFYRSLEAYRASFKNKSDVLVLEPNSEFFKYFKNPGKAGK